MKVTIVFEVIDQEQSIDLHELLCKAFHECDQEAIKALQDNVIDIVQVNTAA